MAKGAKTGGRQKGTPNKVTGDLRAMISNALELAGGVTYLKTQAEKNPAAFLALVGKTLPRDVNLGGDSALNLTIRLSGN